MAAQQDRKLPFGKIEPNSAKYFWSCALGGVVGKYSLTEWAEPMLMDLTISLW